MSLTVPDPHKIKNWNWESNGVKKKKKIIKIPVRMQVIFLYTF